MGEEFPNSAGWLLAGFAPGARIAGYRLEEQVGAGGMAVVFRATDERLGRQVALKILAPALASDEAFRQRFIRESRAAASVDDPHIIPVHEAGEADGVLFIAMRYVPGRDARTLLHRQGPLPADRAAAIISVIASALDAAHAAGLVHRDVKPANMLVDARPGRPDHVYLSDFGISKRAMSSAGLTGTGQHLGTPDYIAPEQIGGKPVDGRTDQYALACAAFELLTGQPPYQRDDPTAVIWAHLSAQPPPLASRRPGLPGAADHVFARALAKDPASRYARCLDFAEALRASLGLAPYQSGPGVAQLVGQTPVSHPPTEIAHGIGAATPSTSALQAPGQTRPGRPGYESDAAPKSPGRRRGAAIASVTVLAAAAITATSIAVAALRHPHAVLPVLRPIGLGVQGRSYTTVQVDWSAPRTGPEPGRYVIFQNGKAVGSVLGGTTTYEATSLAPGTRYKYQVLAVRGGQRSALSAATYATTLAPLRARVAITAVGGWVDTGLHVNTGDYLTITATGSWTGNGSNYITGPNGYSQPWGDNFFNLQDLGVCAYCAGTHVPHWGALISYTGSSPPPVGSYTSTAVAPDAHRIGLVGSNFSGPSPFTGELWLAFNDDAYSGHTSDNSGQVTATLTVIPA